MNGDVDELDVEVREARGGAKGVWFERVGGGIDGLSASAVVGASCDGGVGLVELERDERDGAPICGFGARLLEVFVDVGTRFFVLISVFPVSNEHFRLPSSQVTQQVFVPSLTEI